jgi:hypothetical protein
MKIFREVGEMRRGFKMVGVELFRFRRIKFLKIIKKSKV